MVFLLTNGFLKWSLLPNTVLLFSSGPTASILVAFMVYSNIALIPLASLRKAALAPLFCPCPNSRASSLVYPYLAQGGMLWSALGSIRSLRRPRLAWF